MYFDIEVYKGNDNIFVAVCPELNLFGHGNTQQEAVEVVKSNIEKFLSHSAEFAEVKYEIDQTARFYSSGSAQVH